MFADRSADNEFVQFHADRAAEAESLWDFLSECEELAALSR